MPRIFLQPESVFRDRANAIVVEQAARIRQLIPSAHVKHIGGTSIPGALTKGDVDVLVCVDAALFDRAVSALRSLYAVNQPENWTASFASFKDDSSLALPFGAQLVTPGHCDYEFTALQDRLLRDPTALEAYNAAKQAHAESDDDSYRAAKRAVIEALLADGQR